VSILSAGRPDLRRVLATSAVVSALPAPPLLAAALAPGTGLLAPLFVTLAGGVLLTGAVAGPTAMPGRARGDAFDWVAGTALVAWGACLDVYLVARALGDGPPTMHPTGVLAAGVAYALGSVWAFRHAEQLFWRWPLICTGAAIVWLAVVLVA
jgi:hypothetical protein